MLHTEINVMASAAFKEAYLELVPGFERNTGHSVVTQWVPSAILVERLKGGELADLVILSSKAIDALVAAGILRERRDLARSGIAVAVKHGASQPDIGSGGAIKQAVLDAKSVVYSKGPSGVYLKALFERMGISDRIASKLIVVQGEPAGAAVARGDAEIGFQQMSELLPVPGIDIVGPLPADIQEITTFSTGVHARSPQSEAAKALAAHLSSADAAAVIRAKGMEPI